MNCILCVGALLNLSGRLYHYCDDHIVFDVSLVLLECFVAKPVYI